MADDYAPTTALQTLPISNADYERLLEEFSDEMDMAGLSCETVELHEFNRCGFGSPPAPADNYLYLFSELYGISDTEMSDEFRDFMASVIKKAGMPYLEFSWAGYCTKPRPGSSDGGRIRWYANGDLEWSDSTFALKELTSACQAVVDSWEKGGDFLVAGVKKCAAALNKLKE